MLNSCSDKSRVLFFLHINVKMLTIVGILTFMSRKIFMLSLVEHEFFYNFGASLDKTSFTYRRICSEYVRFAVYA